MPTYVCVCVCVRMHFLSVDMPITPCTAARGRAVGRAPAGSARIGHPAERVAPLGQPSWYSQVRPCTCPGIILKGPVRAWTGRPVDPSEQLGRDTRSQPCPWTTARGGFMQTTARAAPSVRPGARHLRATCRNPLTRGRTGRPSLAAHLAASTLTPATNGRAQVLATLAERRRTWLPTGAPAWGTRGPQVSSGSWGKHLERPEGFKGGGGVPKPAPWARPRVMARRAPQRAEGCPTPRL